MFNWLASFFTGKKEVRSNKDPKPTPKRIINSQFHTTGTSKNTKDDHKNSNDDYLFNFNNLNNPLHPLYLGNTSSEEPHKSPVKHEDSHKDVHHYTPSPRHVDDTPSHSHHAPSHSYGHSYDSHSHSNDHSSSYDSGSSSSDCSSSSSD